jgi:hypothetical protein
VSITPEECSRIAERLKKDRSIIDAALVGSLSFRVRDEVRYTSMLFDVLIMQVVSLTKPHHDTDETLDRMVFLRKLLGEKH